MPKRVVLLPGLDGTGQLFAAFVAARSKTITATAVSYPVNRLLSYSELLPFAPPTRIEDNQSEKDINKSMMLDM